ncbi:LITAF domain-containing protein-like [Branchiostoma lanceolatum]|uniref:LITAF domain-containing protein-like n=1 Tax=Branchiostoma lanceolatum TaxID=7740 RepID=UPI0034562621
MADVPPPYSPYPTKEGLVDPSPPVQAYTYPQPAAQTIVMTSTVQQPLIKINPASFPVEPVQLQCPHCNATVRTETQMVIGAVTWLVFFLLIVMLVGFLGLCFVPFFVDSTKDVRHTCPNCKNHLGTYHRMG